jgi:hypothetical protein
MESVDRHSQPLSVSLSTDMFGSFIRVDGNDPRNHTNHVSKTGSALCDFVDCFTWHGNLSNRKSQIS